MATISEAMTGFRKSLGAVEEQRVATAALVKAAATSEAVGTAMAPMIVGSLESLQAAMKNASEALATVVQAAQPAKPEPEKKPAKAA